jgi:MFS family permease
MSPSEAGILFCISAICLFTFGLTITGFLIDKCGVKTSLMIGLSLYATGKFLLIFAEYRWQLYLIMTTVTPLGISIIFPALLLGVKKLTFENARPIAFSFFFGAMVLGAIVGGPLIDIIRFDYKTTTWHYTHHNPETDQEEERIQEFSAWRTICFIGFVLNILLIILLAFYNKKKEEKFLEKDVDWGKSKFLITHIFPYFRCHKQAWIL